MPHVDTPYKYIVMPEYPHMGPQDAAIWTQFIRSNPDRFNVVWYDVRVGERETVHGDAPATIAVAWWDLTRWRVDVIAEDAENIYVIEIKPRANAKALGQALAYSALFIDNWKPQKPVIPVVITDTEILSTKSAALAMGVQYWLTQK